MLTEIDTSSCVLFLGSGFSAEGKNILGLAPPVGDGLRQELISLLEDQSYQAHDLQTVSEAAGNDSTIDLYQELYNRFTITEMPNSHKALLALPWRRIYTTNYDDAVECISPDRAYFNYDEAKPRRLLDGTLIHLHGVIRSTNQDNVLEQLVLGERTYVRQHLEKSPWYDEFDRDVRFADATFFLGYSLRDQHITALLMKNPATITKVYFITRGKPDKPTTTKFGQYGQILTLGIAGFSSLVQSLPKPSENTAPNQLRSLRYLDPLQDKATIAPPTSPEVRNLLTFGSFNFKRMIAGLSDESYVVGRATKIDEAAKAIETARTLLVDSRLGNGKTIFLNLLAASLSTKGYKCFLCKSDTKSASRDLGALRTLGKVAIFFDSYGLAVDLIQEFSVLPNAVFVVAVRSAVRAVQMHEILGKFPSPSATISLNSLLKQEREAFSKLAHKTGLLSENIDQKISVAADFRELVLTTFDNTQVRKAIQKELFPSLSGMQVRKILLVGYLLKQSGHDADPAFLRDVTGVDPYDALSNVGSIAAEVFDLGDQLQVRSAVFSAYLVENFFESEELVEIIETLIVATMTRREQLTYRRMAGTLMQVSFLSRILKRLPNYQRDMHALFERLRRNNAINAEPLFWLQYAILVMDDDKATSENFITTAYKRAGALDGFRTYQLDTFALRLALKVEAESDTSYVSRFDYIVEKLDLVTQMLKEASHRYYAVDVLNDIEPFVSMRAENLTVDQRNRLLRDLLRAIRALEELPLDYRVQTGSDLTKSKLIASKAKLTAWQA